ncbi:hypothetical protein A2U01_0065777 [Trifolium medium]|uniref:Uncharacterized protein n=1 Tax=Trifolium medium TaxID=97028 RepID=A0A392S6S6_9FABA|nr:hypothetical protein [Trifolium medium]
MFCLWRGTQLALERRAVLCAKGGLTFGRLCGAQLGWRNAQRSPVSSVFLLVSARHAAGAGATRSAAMLFWIFFCCLRNAQGSLRGVQCVGSGLTFC